MNVADSNTATLLSNSRILMTVAVVVIVATIVWHLSSSARPQIKNIITALIITIAIGVIAYPELTKEQEGTDKENIEESAIGLSEQGQVNQTGGTIITIKVLPRRDINGKLMPVDESATALAMKVISKRFYAYDIKDFHIEAKNTDTIVLELPGIQHEETNKVSELLVKTARFELKQVHPESRSLADALAAEAEEDRVLPPGYRLYRYQYLDYDDDQLRTENLLIKRRSALDGSYITHAQKLYGPHEGQITIDLSPEGGRKMSAVTSRMRHGIDRLAILLNDEILTAPVVQDTLGKTFVISGLESADEARNIAMAMLNPLSNPIQIEELRTIPARQAKK